MTDPLAQLTWLDGDNPLDDIFCVSFFHQLAPREVLRRFGAPSPEGERMTFDDLIEVVSRHVEQTQGASGSGYVGVVRCGEWSVAIEPYGWEGTLPEVITGLSLSSEVVAINRHDYAEDHFVHAVDGTVITGLLPDVPSQRYGSEPERLVPLLREVGLDPLEEDGERPEFPIASAFAVAARMTGVLFTPQLLNQPLLVGDIRT
ncbi:hypothetical protein SacmaDRAFT_3635 [Saccharomonospora marina XMU15]|uniref:Uncharacterized protein n=1 Tax=Saccharomonospora marina XMU15 TaxID=882083 RepID=H5WYX7_9PSEU|nr:DUF6461 domain-containing protein [Saccharomonospora marina]EHR51849.1 hypothetical protein SacmaDRAFT_3635 [Saccharomonospora marina XMU15]